VAADAVDAENDNHNIIHASQDRVSDSSGLGYASLFSPPVETEGGFIPKQPPILEGYYDVTMTSTSTTDSPNLHEGIVLILITKVHSKIKKPPPVASGW
jgi:hypothetical protein